MSERKEYIKWTDERIIAEAKKYNTATEFRKAMPYVYSKGLETGALKKVFRKLDLTPKRQRHANGYWTREKMLSEARKFESLKELREGNISLYILLHKSGLLNELKIASNRKKRGYWNTFENVQKEAVKYKRKSDFSKGSTSAYQSAVRHGWIDSIVFSGE